MTSSEKWIINTGDKFNKWTVVQLKCGKNHFSNSKYSVLCDCGETSVVVAKDLVTGHSKSCGCLRVDNMKTNEDSRINAILSTYKWRASKKNIEFNLDRDVFIELLLGSCYYCGVIGGCESKDCAKHHSSARKIKNKLIYTGIDRVDASKGYIPSNVVSCCIVCNKSKNTMNQEEFIKWINLVYTNLLQKTTLTDNTK